MKAVVLILSMLLSPLGGWAAEYYVDAKLGDDANSGTSAGKAWRTLEKVNASRFEPGDQVLFRSGGVWSGQLLIGARGEAGRPVVFRADGTGPRPRIEAGGRFEDAVLLRNCQHVVLRDLEVTNTGTEAVGAGRLLRRGVHVLGDNAGTLEDVTVSGLFVHDVNGTLKKKDNGGIIFTTRGEKVPTRFDGLRIERNIVWHVDRSGIVAQSYHAARTRWFPSTHVVIRDNWLADLGGDGITPWATDACLVEHNIVRGANERAGTHNAGIWPWSTDNTVIRLNDVSGVRTLLDGQAFDSDYNCRDTVIEFNLSHDNEGGFLLICTPGRRNARENVGNSGTVARYNISRYDAARTFYVSAAERSLVHNNAVYLAPGADVQVLVLTEWSGWAKGLEVRENLFVSQGVGRYGHAVSRGKDGSCGIGPGWGPATDVVFRRNRYLGVHENRPVETDADDSAAPDPITFDDWPGPQFDPHQPDTFGRFIDAHRGWMLRLMKRQFPKNAPTGQRRGS